MINELQHVLTEPLNCGSNRLSSHSYQASNRINTVARGLQIT